jgi:hypothetical protein
MKRGDDVFFFTLIDFLLQVFFFGLLLFVVLQAKSKDEGAALQREEAAKERLLKGVGVSSLTELTDLLTRLAPLEELRGTSEFMARNGGASKAISAVEVIKTAGGPENVDKLAQQLKIANARVSELEGGWGKASCLPNVTLNGKVQPKSIARVVVDDEAITLEEPTPEMFALLARHGLTFSAVERLSPPRFRTVFSQVVSKQPECRYFLSVVTRTQYLEPMRAVWAGFRTQ